jgi:hypothetical protein
MPASDLVAVCLPDGSSRATFIDPRATVCNLVEALLAEDGESIAAALQTPPGAQSELESWALQSVLISEPNRQWSDEELLQLGDRALTSRVAGSR